MSSYTEKQLAGILAENEGERISLRCSRHNYTASRLPPTPKGCKDCWFAFYAYDLANTPAHLRRQRVDELEAVIRHAIEFEQKGKFGKDLELYAPDDPRFKISIERDAE